MRRQSALLLTLTGVLILAACASAPDAYRANPGLTVIGTGSVKLTPDIATVNLGIQTQNRNVGQAVAQNSTIAARVLEAIGALGVDPADIQTTYFSVWGQPVYDDFGNPTGESTYFADNTVTVTVRQVDRLGEILQEAVDAGANTIHGVTFNVSDPSQAQEEARDSAMADARAKAEQMAAGAGATLGEPMSISTSISLPPVPYYPAYYGLGGGGGEGPPVSTGSYEVQVQVTVTYAIR
jgi:hypothetical protein